MLSRALRIITMKTEEVVAKPRLVPEVKSVLIWTRFSVESIVSTLCVWGIKFFAQPVFEVDTSTALNHELRVKPGALPSWAAGQLRPAGLVAVVALFLE